MNATKRKFNTLLNGLGSKPNLSTRADETSQMPPPKGRESLDAAFKKRRTDLPSTSSTSTIPSQPGSISTFSSIRKKAASITTTETDLPSAAPTYAPWDRNAFLQRLKTFATLSDWSSKPERVNEVEWAKRGWVCGKRERVRCCSCNVELLVKLNKKVLEDGTEEGVYIASNIEKQVVDKYVELIVTAHSEDCLWRARGCDDTIFKLPLNNPTNTLRTIKERYNGLAALGDALPYPNNIHPPENFNLDKIISYLPPDFFTSSLTTTDSSSAPKSKINRVALTMALFGWGAMPNYTHSAAECTACFRRLGLWLFKSKEISPTGETVVSAAMNHLDVIKEHRDYCPWKNAEAQSGGSTASANKERLAAWEVVLRVLRNDWVLRNPDFEKRVARDVSVNGDAGSVYGGGDEGEDARSVREEKDKEWTARLRRVKSLFNTKEKKKMNRLSAPAPKAKDNI